ncbi:MAG TPA: polymorphic toxin-type HINT domain-containing protein [Pirellulaceae bacterium]|nr:polymorphic toxin-type HINT domain-containing protein [Pirellulaceae bacterium]
MSAAGQTLSVTAEHPFWSVTRDEFVPAGELVLGEEVVTIDGQIWRLTSITPRAGPETVYNFEVAGEHVYYVTSDGLLVHNSCLGKAIKNARGFIRSQWSVVKGVVAKRFGRWLSGDHVLPLQAIKTALRNAGIKPGSEAWKWAMKWADNPKNLRLMNESLNKSKGALNAVAWSKTPLGSLVPRRYLQNVLRKQYKNANELSHKFKEQFGVDLDFSFFFR